MDLLSFSEAMQEATRTTQHRCAVLLGNGFSMAWDPKVFSYGALLGSCDFSKAPQAKLAFETLDTTDFEQVMRSLDTAATLAKNYTPEGACVADQQRRDAYFLREALVEAIARTHPDHVFTVPTEAYEATGKFLDNFEEIFTLNYDLLLYWTLVSLDPRRCRDGFRRSDFQPLSQDWPFSLEWTNDLKHSQKIYFLHGALHLFSAGGSLWKVRSQNGQCMVKQIKERIRDGQAPLFVCEGRSDQKRHQIDHHPYLRHCFSRLKQIRGGLFVYGHSMSESDNHILGQIAASSIPVLNVGLYGNPTSEKNTSIQQRALALKNWRCRVQPAGPTLQVKFFDAETAGLWKNPSPDTVACEANI